MTWFSDDKRKGQIYMTLYTIHNYIVSKKHMTLYTIHNYIVSKIAYDMSEEDLAMFFITFAIVF